MKRKVFGIILIFIFLIFATTSINYAFLAQGGGGGSAPGKFDPDDATWQPNSTTEAVGADRLLSIGNTIIGFLRTVGSIVSVAVLAVIGIKYMMGSVEEKAEYKQTMKPYIIGAVLVFGITNILAIIVDVAISLTD